MTFIEQMRQYAAMNPKRIVLPEGEEPRVIDAMKSVVSEKLAYPILLGNSDRIKQLASERGISLNGVRIIDPVTSTHLQEYADMYYELRKHKGMTKENALEEMKDPVFFGAMLIRQNEADGSVCGSITTTAKTVQAGLRIIGTEPGIKTVSSIFIMVLPDKKWGVDGIMGFADCAIVPNPDAQTLAEIALTTAKSFKSMVKVEPAIAMLSFSTKGSASHADADKVIAATKIVKELRPDLLIDGELQADAAIIPKVCQSKAPGSPLNGKANVLIFPDLDAANISHKLVQRMAGAEAIGPFLQGLAKPANDLSRGCSVEDIVNVVAVTSVQAQS